MHDLNRELQNTTLITVINNSHGNHTDEVTMTCAWVMIYKITIIT